MQVEMCENDDEAWATFNSSDCINDYVTDTRELSERSQVHFARREMWYFRVRIWLFPRGPRSP